MTRIPNNVINNLAECNLLHDINNNPKEAKHLNSHCSHILHRCINTRKSKAKVKTFAFFLKVNAVPRL